MLKGGELPKNYLRNGMKTCLQYGWSTGRAMPTWMLGLRLDPASEAPAPRISVRACSRYLCWRAHSTCSDKASTAGAR